MFEAGKKHVKKQVEIEVYLDDGTRLLGKLSLAQGQRISDLLNDERQFLPIEMPDGNVVIYRKAVIAKVAPLDQLIDEGKVTDPYEILGVARTISDDDLNRSYHQISAENHPDKVQSSGLSPQFLAVANARMARINDAYTRIVSMRKAAAANGRHPDR